MRPSDPSSGYVWRPDEATRANARLTEFLAQHDLEDFSALHARSVRDPAWFHEALLSFLDIQFHKPYDQILDTSRGPAWPRWCVGGRMNIVVNCLDKYVSSPVADRTALIWESEQGETWSLTYQQLYERVNQAANGMRQLGLGVGDAVGLYMPLTANEAIALLAVAKIGGIILPLFSGYGAGAVASRLEDGAAKALITADGYQRNGSLVEMKPVADEAVSRVDSVEHVIVERITGSPVPMVEGRDQWWHELVENQSVEAVPADTSAEDPLMIIYTSGTTGRPKGAVHTHCGFPVKAAQDMAFGMDVHPAERIFWITDMGWMMGPWLVFGSLLLGATMFLYDGAPMYPQAGRVWQMIERHSINQLGLSPTYVRALIPYGRGTVKQHNLQSLRLIGATGEAWTQKPWNWLFEVACGGKKPIINYTGGTELSGGIAMGNPLMPLKPTAISAPCPGMDADVFDEQGQPVVGEVGELVIKGPWIG
ncbi:MAG: AMP-binding protein, partial [Anaerolineales bacterium]